MTANKCKMERAEAFCRGFLLTKDRYPDRSRMFCRGFLAIVFHAKGT